MIKDFFWIDESTMNIFSIYLVLSCFFLTINSKNLSKIRVKPEITQGFIFLFKCFSMAIMLTIFTKAEILFYIQYFSRL